ncbi:MAG TPA: cysteine hydrolase [Caldithrix sp.]|nr:cysteine hydrolase [Calditrichaceae bacterium]HEM49076.1 cysteine hydrolase [Caldithrix sp.]
MSFNFLPPDKVNVPELQLQDKVMVSAKNSALIIVDMQNDFVKEGGNLVVPSAHQTIEPIGRLLKKCRDAKMPVVFTQDTMYEGDPEFDVWPEHCIFQSVGWAIIDELKPLKNELVCQKNRYDGFYGTNLEHYLSRVWKVDNVIIVGTVANICVLHTAGSAGLRWFNIVMPANGISALNEFDQAMTLRQVSWLYSGKITRDCSDIEIV